MASRVPRVVVVTRPSELTLLVARHGTKEQARFFLRERGQALEPAEAAHHALEHAVHEVTAAIPLAWRRARVGREDLPRFLFEPDDVVAAVGQDGLVANVAKYLDGQPVVGVCPEGKAVLARCPPELFADALADVVAGRARLEARTMVEARLDDGQRLLSLNEVFLGHRTHQSARYRVSAGGATERHSSSGVVVATGTGASGWARSIHRERHSALVLPAATEPSVAFFVREAFPSKATGTSLTEGRVGEGEPFVVTSEMGDGGVVFGDGIEDDRLAFGWGIRARVGVAREKLALVVP